MPRIFMLMTLLVLANMPAVMAQQPKMQRAEIKTPQATCEACKQIIESVAPKYVDGLM